MRMPSWLLRYRSKELNDGKRVDLSSGFLEAGAQVIEADEREGVVRLVDQALAVLSDERKR